MAPEDADTYKCYATNDYGRAVCTAVLNVIEGISHITTADYDSLCECDNNEKKNCSYLFTVGFSKAKELQKTYGDGKTGVHCDKKNK